MTGVLDGVLSSVEQLDPFPDVAVRALELSLRPSEPASTLVTLAACDPGLTAKVLRAANAPERGFERKIASIHAATLLLGETWVRDLVLAAAPRSALCGYGSATEVSNRALWKQALVNALAAAMIARTDDRIPEHEAFTVGLLQNVGAPILDRHFPRERNLALRAVDRGAALTVAERDRLEIDHAELAARLFDRWRFPDRIVTAIRHHHAPQRAEGHIELAELACLAEALASRFLCADALDVLAYGTADVMLARRRIGDRRVDATLALLDEELEHAIEVLKL